MKGILDGNLRARKRRVAPILAVLAVAGLALVVAAQRRSRGSAGGKAEEPLFVVKEGPLTISVTESGTIKPREQEIIKNEIEGRSAILYLIPEGTRVNQGDLLVELDASQLQDSKIDQEIRVQNAEASYVQSRENLGVVTNQAQSDIDKADLQLRFAREDLQQYKDGEFPNTLKEHAARITLAQEENQRAEQKLRWSRILFKEKYLAESELQADELAVKKAVLDIELATNSLALLRHFTYRRKIDELESNVKQAEMALERVRKKASADVVQADADLRAKESEFKRQTAKLDKIRRQIGKARITAPRDGLVVYATSTKAGWRGDTQPLAEGQEVRERQELIYLPTAATFLAEVKVHESNLDRIRPGLAVRVTVDALPGREFTGRVKGIAPLPDAMSMFMNPDLKIYTTEVLIDGGGDVLRTGMSCQVEVVVEHYPSAVYAPVQAVVRVNGQATAFVRTPAGAEARPVRVGLDNNRMVRILDGLKPGERVLLAPPLDRATAPDDARAKPPAGVGSSGPVERPKPAPGSEPADPAGPVASATNAAGMPAGPRAPDEREKSSGWGSWSRMSPEERERMRERLEKMTPEEREAMKKQFQKRRQEAAGEGPRGPE